MSTGRISTEIEIESQYLVLALTGPNECHLKSLERIFHITASLRGFTIHLAGDADDVALAESTITELLSLIAQGTEVGTSEVNHVAESMKRKPDRASRSSGEAVKLGNGRKSIVPKGQVQQEYIQAILSHDVTFGVGPAGCHRKGQKVLMYDGTLKVVECVRAGDQLMGPDSTPRNVLSLCHGYEDMVEITPKKGQPWVVNQNHILTLKHTYKKSGGKYYSLDEVKDVSISDVMEWGRSKKREHKLFRVPVNFCGTGKLPLEPYFLGLLLGDGSFQGTPKITTTSSVIESEVRRQADIFGLSVVMHDSDGERTPSYSMCASTQPYPKNPISQALSDLGLQGFKCEDKFIPHCYKTASKENRLAILAGILDTDGSLDRSGVFDLVSKSKSIIDDTSFIARSLGFACYPKPCFKKAQTGDGDTYYRLCISGNLSEIPTRLPNKQAAPRKQRKSVLHTGFSLRRLPTEEYFGFCLDGDNRYLLDDFTVTHNTGKTYLAMAVACSALLAGKYKKIILTRPAVEAGEKLGFLPGDLAEKVNPYLRPLYDALGDMVDKEKAEELIQKGTIEVAPLAFMRGRTLNNAFVILDEAQNTTADQMKMFLTRLGYGSKAVVTGDVTQIDLPHNQRSGLADAVGLIKNVEGISFTHFSDMDVVRHPMVQRIVRAYEARADALAAKKYDREQDDN
jgi:phosphate starvation-inducible protein PhoH